MNEPVSLLPAWDELKATLDSGDVLLFAGESRFAHGIKRFTRCHWSHSALVGRAQGRLLLFEAALDNDLADIKTHAIGSGVNLFDLEEWLRHFGGETAIRQLHVERTDAMRTALVDFVREVHGRPYERNKLEMLRANFDGPFGANREEDLSSFFCSELVAESYRRMGLLPDHPPANEYTPRDFSSERATPLPLLLGATLSLEVLVCKCPQRGPGSGDT